MRKETRMKTFKCKNVILILCMAIGLIFIFACGHNSHKLVKTDYPEGFSLKHPADWQAKILDNTYIWVSPDQETNSPFLLVYPFFLKEKIKSSFWIEKKLPALSKFFAEVEWEIKKQIRPLPDEAAAKFKFRRKGAQYQGIALCSIHQKSGVLYVMAAPLESYDKFKDQLVAMLESFRFEDQKQERDQIEDKPKIRYASWQDPQERAFSLEVPQGWEVKGGTFRRASVDLIHVLRAESPDQRMVIQFNDSNIPVFALPSPVLAMAGFVEGSWYSPGYDVRMMVKRYTPGVHFMTEYLNSTYRPHLRNFQIVNKENRPDIVSSFNRIYSQYSSYGISFTLHAGEAAFQFDQGSLPFVGYGLALTQVVQSTGMQGGGNWSLALMIIYTCPAPETQTVREIANHMFHSVRMNPQWVASQQQLAVNVSQIVTQTNQEISRIIDESYWSRQATLDDTHRRFSNTILGVTDVVDPETGEKWKVESGHNYYWRREHTNRIVGTEVYIRPEIDFSPLKEF